MAHGTLLRTCAMAHHPNHPNHRHPPHRHHRQGVMNKVPSNYWRLITLLVLVSGFLYKNFLVAFNLLPPLSPSTTTITTTTTTGAVQHQSPPPMITKTDHRPQRQQQEEQPQPLPQPQPQQNSTFTICLLLKDDNVILNEWLAYHYHTMNLRHLIVAIDPSSTTSPSFIFQQWRQIFGLEVEEWTDHDFMPDFFLQGRYHEIPHDYIKITNRTHGSIWHTSAGVTNINIIEQELQVINNHRFRQVYFLHKCAQSLRQRQDEKEQQQQHQQAQNDSFVPSSNSSRNSSSPTNCTATRTTTTNTTTIPQEEEEDEESTTSTTISSSSSSSLVSSSVWMAHIDTDEYIVINPRLRARQPPFLQSILPSRPYPSSLFHFLEAYPTKYPNRIQVKCIAMGMIRFGAVEEEKEEKEDATTTTIKWNRSHFETLRWRYYGAAGTTVNQKVILDIANMPHNDPLFHELAYSIHRPSIEQCPEFPSDHRASIVNKFQKYPLSVNHYLGSYERYSSRTDVRRNPVLYQKFANASAYGGGGKDDDWLSGWLDSFIETHGQERVARVLKDYLL
jgi:hypothetical protein